MGRIGHMFSVFDLSEKRCIPCEAGSEPLDRTDIAYFLGQLRLNWQVLDAKCLSHEFTFKNFMEAMVFVNDIAALAEDEGHHPDLTIHYNRVHVELTTHAINGLSDNDFILARKIELCC